jgi:hypothetical protein
MKKILLLLLLSLAFVGSANANSIDGAFGYKLGETYKKEDTSFVPKNPLPYLDEYFVLRTPISKKIYQITGLTGPEDYFVNFCANYYTDPYKEILRLLEKKYGKFEKTRDEFQNFSEGSSDWTIQDVEFSYEQGERSIRLECNHSLVIKDVGSSGHYFLGLTYFDSDLGRQARDERRKLKEIEEEGYDI